MSNTYRPFSNPFRAEMADEKARQHWDDHVDIRDGGMHEMAMADRAEMAGRTVDEQRDHEFSEWYADMKFRGIARF